MYEFPPQFHVWRYIWNDRPLNLMLWERFMSLGLRTTDPEEADFFFIPALDRSCNNTRWDDTFAYITTHYAKYWNRRQGRDHLVTQPADWGRCEPYWYRPPAAPFMENVTVLHQWGLTVDRSAELGHKEFKACHKPNQDLVISGQSPEIFMSGVFKESVWHPERRAKPVVKTSLASMFGSLCAWNSNQEPPCPNKWYSLGVRGALWELLRGRPGFNIAKRVGNQGRGMAESEFCLSPTGAGWGKRGYMGAALGCIPVIISDHVAQAFEPFLDWNDFGVWIPESHMNETEAILRGFTPEQKAEKMRKLYCAARHFTYTSVYGNVFEGDDGRYDAIAMIVRILRARRDHPGVPDDRLAQVDQGFADFLACRSPAPPLPLAHTLTPARGNGSDGRGDGFPRRTVTTAAWVRSAQGWTHTPPAAGVAAASDAGAGAGVGAGGQQAVVARSGELTFSGPLCLHNAREIAYPVPGGLDPDSRSQVRAGYCLPGNMKRPGDFFPGGSVTCPPTGPITQCAVMV
ncbi:hypothetical protein HYH03_008316 [Edaphochlamys debaryana]|uniref:Exostosin GT47 domain-containing protein n=1 Tax=Edaphochlamys debaryana TaxID=47281 RepID=A0A835Y0J0_9CHLO|nr:hypothetical protein HYH03_008316 [Edaphochlamys debaryana]|eukprot:KAG2493500.1 hypothetical protein HYH03_008316 [Edaphochlamys debaryana]